MLENIRQIGIFMIIAQTVMHFAAGKQYEKYMKIIAGVIVLLLFIRPFVSDSENIAAKWQEEAARMMEQIERRSEAGYQMSYVVDPTQTEVIQQIEEEMKNRLNDIIADRDEYVAEVAIDFEKSRTTLNMGSVEGTGELVFDRVRIMVQKSDEAKDSRCEDKQSLLGNQNALPGTDEKGVIQIDEIVVGSETSGSAESNVEMHELRRLFAQALGIAEDRVEVGYLGGW